MGATPDPQDPVPAGRSDGTDLHAVKRDLRARARQRRRTLASRLTDAALRERAGRSIADRVLELLPPRMSRVAAYESLPSEPPTGTLIETLLAAEHEVIVPVTLEDYSLAWRHATAGAVADAATIARRALKPGSDVLGADALATCDLVITPGLSVDRRGIRLGQGGGCYDRALGHRPGHALVVTLLHDGEVSEDDLPAEEHDVPVDGWITTSGELVLLGTDRRPD